MIAWILWHSMYYMQICWKGVRGQLSFLKIYDICLSFVYSVLAIFFSLIYIFSSPALFHSTKSIWDTHGQISIAAASSYRVSSRHHLRWFMLVWLYSLLKCLCFLVLPSSAMAELLLEATISEFLLPHWSS